MSESKSDITREEVARMLSEKRLRIHFIGILGVSMSSLAAWYIDRGHTVSGSDARNETGEINPLGVKISKGGDFSDLRAADLVIYSLAVGENDRERRLSRELGIPEVSRAVMLGAVMSFYACRIGVSGTHGKSTTSAILYHILKQTGRGPTAMIGAKINGDKCFDLGGTEYFIYEACEYRDAFLQFTPDYAIITSVELDHTDYFGDISAVRNSFARSVSGAKKVYISTDVENYRELLSEAEDVVYYGERCPCGLEYRIASMDMGGSRFALYQAGVALGDFYLPVPGEFNVKNAVAAIAVALDLGIEACQIIRALSTFRGIPGRLEYVGSVGSRRVYLDYAHHPTAIRETLSLAASLSRPVTVVFKPHTYTRTRDLASDFAKALSAADHVVITDIYPARESAIPGISSEWLASMTDGAVYLPEREVAEWVLSHTGGTVILMGAGDLSSVKEMIFNISGENKL